MDPLSAAASVIAVVQISGKVFQLCQTYYSEVKEARKDIPRLRDEVTSLQDVLTNVADLAEEDSGSANASALSLLNQPDGPLQQCQRDLQGLVAKLDPGDEKDGARKGKMKQFGWRALKWPFSSKDVDKLLATIGRHKATFKLALTANNAALARAIKDDIVKLSDGVAKLQVGQKTFIEDGRRQKIHQWLSPPDPSSSHNSACKKRQPTTGAWFVGSDEFKKWKTGPKSFLWLHGIPGCGKTILCSTIVEEVMLHCKSDPAVAVAYFYFDFNDVEKQRHENLLRSLILQLSMQSNKIPEALDALFTRSQGGQQQPISEALALTLQHMINDFHQTFIILDALDECKEREELLELLENIISWKLEKLHILATSRRERDIEEALEPLITGQICIQSALVDADIHIHIRERLQNDPKLRKWPVNVQMEIEKSLMDGANGMFRWVVCQLDTLRKCLKLDALRKALKSLPKTLDDTYTRILYDIDEEYSQDVLKILRWLAYSARPLRIEEVAEVIAIEIDGNPQFDLTNRLREPRDILTICSSLVTIVTVKRQIINDWKQEEVEELRLAHFSVKEYLLSDRVQIGPASRYSLGKYTDDYIAQMCLTYLLYFDGSILLTSTNRDEFPLARYAAQYWTQHAGLAGIYTEQTKTLSMRLLLPKNATYLNWLRLYNPEKPWEFPDMTKDMAEVASPLYYISLAGLFELARLLVEMGADVNGQGGRSGNPLQAAATNEHDQIVQLLLESGADIEARNNYGETALYGAAEMGHDTVVRLLLENGADIEARGNYGETALHGAAEMGHDTVVRLLLENGADMEARRNYGETALHGAAEKGHDAVVRLLLENGADMEARRNYGETALHGAAEKGHDAVVRLLLETGADIKAQDKG